ncbi:trifunctional transcriptional regulator/proline dehydrogenase/L-glutamate gamma-semialdehyde dehydrogenase [Kineobactrum sediminis]|uniref:Bifunctional protein PutA n=1 Tax=Kineobactrum sediminis TaxID=1905677 RepID=A0A2N5Y2W8_9GAMM|nr:bifunctional proline dehydrogenase/L-glutamate gamma-semialdehyde dehydrogenase PutA [Kineobactrum sediminis]PLW82709.1 trifunctional transcriptional regulator/proline dehydrogenase/L-glutamate gamma-semialdehyde dehydrogenase [Kineobactrum sediminis]
MLYEGSLATDDPIRQQMRNCYRKDEDTMVRDLLPIADIGNAARSRAWERARKLVVNIRREQRGKGGVDALLQEYALSTEEGIVLMCLAEALLRVPDRITIDRLIRDKLADGNWSAHLGQSDSLFVNASAWGLLLTGKVVNYNDEDNPQQFGLLKKTMGRLGEPVIRASVRYAMQIMGTQFVMGTTIDKALERARPAEQSGYRYSYDMLGEAARTADDAQRYYDSYLNAIEAIGRAAKGKGPDASPGISIKLSAIHPRYEFAQRARVMEELVPRLLALAIAARQHDIGFTVDAEEADRLELSLDVIEVVFADPALADWSGFGIAVQAYQKRSLFVIEWLHELAQRVGRRMMVRLVKGAYWDTEIKLAQVEGQKDYPVFSRKQATDVSYQACAARLLAYRDVLYPQFATHNAYTVATILELDTTRTGYEFQRLHGMGEALYKQVVEDEQVPCRVYAPVGVHADLLAYLVRRLLENGANSSFVNNIVDEDVPVEDLLEDPVEAARQWRSARNPGIPQPLRLYGTARDNARGVDLTDAATLRAIGKVMTSWQQQLPLSPAGRGTAAAIYNPADRSELIGHIHLADSEAIAAAITTAEAAADGWAATSVQRRGALLRSLADSLEEHCYELMALCCKEAGKTLPDGVAEVREAIDFLRYYATQAEQAGFTAEGLRPRGVILCISPWNFPLAIFLGQVAAALAAGNTVVAKPAEQTSLIALRTFELMQECGFPAGVVSVLVAEGKAVGEQLVPDPRIRAVMFTGSTATGHWIARRLAERADAPIPLIAETGGQNCMIVDSTALPEQVVRDVVTSGFQSAGQRCSALRVLFLQEDIADKVITMIIGAMRELKLGDPSLLATDIGPVIDSRALQGLEDHVRYLDASGRLLHQATAPEPGNHTFFAPRLYEISNLALLEREVFGPIVHVIRYRAEDFDDVLKQINQTGYGLTFGIHSRIEDTCNRAADRIQAGNIYVNRNMIGAIVGVQPFGGRGLSGTGPKAGGPNYLPRLVTTGEEAERVIHQRLLPDPAGHPPEQASILAPAVCSQNAWKKQNLNTRVSVLRQFIARYTRSVVGGNPMILEHTLAAARQQLRFAMELLAVPVTLPGPTGEDNTLRYEARGCLLLLMDDPGCNGEYLMAVISALVAGNSVTGVASETLLPEWQALSEMMLEAGLPAGLFSLQPLSIATTLLQAPALGGAMVHARSPYLQAVARLLVEREGALLPLISCVSPRALLQQTLLEKSVSIDTTAAGGNASLMTMTNVHQAGL